jgi:preprotein translocase subunit SecD
MATLIGFVLVVIFLFIYYRLSGLVADSVLIFNVLSSWAFSPDLRRR